MAEGFIQRVGIQHADASDWLTTLAVYACPASYVHLKHHQFKVIYIECSDFHLLQLWLSAISMLDGERQCVEIKLDAEEPR